MGEARKSTRETRGGGKKKQKKRGRRGRRLRKGEQAALPRTAGHGGRRAGAGRKKKEGRRNVAHLTRPRLGARTPVHVTLRMRAGRASLRSEVLRKMFERIVQQTRCDDFHIAAYSLQHDHVHLLCEPASREALSRGIRRVAIRYALRMNKLFGRARGKSWGDRYHRQDLTTPRQVRSALLYVLMNAKKHGVCAASASFLDPFSSAAENDVWADVDARVASRSRATPAPARICAAPRFWLLGVGWKRRGLLLTTDAPRPSER